MCNTEDCLHYDYVRLAWDIGFTFEEYDMKNGFDISVIGLVDVEKVAKDRDIPTVVKHIPTLLNFRLDNEMSKVLEPNFIKLFRLSQLAIQYLIFCKKYLDSTVALIKTEMVALNEEKSDLEVCLEEIKSDNDSIRRKYDELKATLSTSIFKCEECAKTFYSEEYLLAHIKRRHQVHNVQMQTEADKLQLEIKELKQRLNNTERLILKDEVRGEKMSPKELDGDKEKELESVEPNNDAIFENSIQFKFEQLKNHIETEINSLKDEDFYKGICERFIKERVGKNLSVTTIQNPTDESTDRTGTVQNSYSLRPQTNTKDVAVAVEVNDVIDSGQERVESSSDSKTATAATSTQTECNSAVSEGTSMSPQPTPRRSSKPHDDGDHQSIGADGSSQTVGGVSVKQPSSKRTSCNDQSSLTTEGRESSQVVMKSIEEKLAKEVEHQRETLEHILDLKLSGSLNKMEAQMTAFWEKLNAWESNMTFAKSSSVPSMNVHSEPVRNVKESVDLVPKRQNSAGSVASSSPIHKMAAKDARAHVKPVKVGQNSQEVPKALPRTSITHKAPVVVVPRASKPAINDVSRFLDSSEEEDGENGSEGSKTFASKAEKTASESTSEEETPSNMKPSDSFKKLLDETLLKRLNHQPTQALEPEMKLPPFRRDFESTTVTSKSTAQDGGPTKLTKLSPIERKSPNQSEERSASDGNNDDGNEIDYKNLKKRLKRRVEESVNQKLKDIGVSPHWKCLPEKSFNKAMEIVEHQATLSKKNINDFHKIRKNIERAIDKEIEKTNEGRKRRATVNLPIGTRNNAKLSVVATPPEYYAPSEASVEIPLQRISGRPTIKPASRRESLLSESITSSPMKTKVNTIKQFQVVKGRNKPDVGNGNVVTIIPSKQTQREPEVTSTAATIGKKTSSGATVAIVERVPPGDKSPPNQKKKVLFNIDSDTEPSEKTPDKQPHQPQTKKDLTFFVQQEKSKLNLGKQAKSKNEGHLELQTGSESSDWDISDVT